MKHDFAFRDEVVGDDPSMTAPPHRLCAHDGTTLAAAKLYQMGKTIMERLAHGVISVVVKTVVCPKCIDLRRYISLTFSQSAKLRQMTVLDIEWHQALRQHITVILGIRPRAWHGTDIRDTRNAGLLHQADKFIERARRVTHCKERISHVIRMVRIVSRIRAIGLSLIVEKALGSEAD